MNELCHGSNAVTFATYWCNKNTTTPFRSSNDQHYQQENSVLQLCPIWPSVDVANEWRLANEWTMSWIQCWHVCHLLTQMNKQNKNGTDYRVFSSCLRKGIEKSVSVFWNSCSLLVFHCFVHSPSLERQQDIDTAKGIGAMPKRKRGAKKDIVK